MYVQLDLAACWFIKSNLLKIKYYTFHFYYLIIKNTKKPMATRKIKRKSRTSRKSTRRKSRTSRKSTRRKSTRRKSTRRKSTHRKSRKSTRRKSTHRKSRKKKCIQKWKTLEHNGVIFPEPYQHLSIPLLYGPGKKSIMLNAEAEEAAMFYAKILHLDHTTNPTFRKNFFADWKKLLPRGTEIKSLDQCDFKNFRDIIDDEATQRKAITKSKKARSKSEKETSEAKYKIALVDGKKQSVGNFRVEPSGLFLGRGKHPKAGLIKKRIRPEDIILNIGELAAIPKPPKGHEWGEIIHDHCVEWLASWKENINNDTKYVW
jgi:DNA topoisomerase-1